MKSVFSLFMPLLALTAISSHSMADVFFKAPSDNVYCHGQGKTVVCTIFKRANISKVKLPKGCTSYQYANAFYVDARGQAHVICQSDYPADVKPQVISYGKTLKGNGWQCTSQKTGMTCKNLDNHGFSLSRTQQRIF